ncbi:MAG: DUF2199 domain-containing protein [Kofleriaceae bacterium]
MGLFDRFRRGSKPPASVDHLVDETERGAFACKCGCERHWLVSRGQFAHDGEIASFVAIPTIHGDERVAWLAIGRGAEPGEWACIRTTLQDSNIAAGIVEPMQTPVRTVIDVARLQTRAQVIGDPARKAWLFQIHDELLRHHDDLQTLFVDGRGRDYSFKMPDCAFALPPERRSPRNQQNFAECGSRLFVRALLPIPISDGTEFRVGVWAEVAAEAFHALMKVFFDDEPAYMATRLAGTVESSLTLAGHQLSGSQVTLAARTADQCLFVTAAEPAWLAAVMQQGVTIQAFPSLHLEIRRNGRAAAS